MILKTNDDVLGRIQELFSECLEKKEFGEFSVTVTMNHGKPVRLQKSDRENLVRYSPVASGLTQEEKKFGRTDC